MRRHFVLLLTLFLVLVASAQKNPIEKEMYRYHKTKTLKWAKKQKAEKVEILFIDDYDNSVFPTEDILRFPNLKHLIINGRSLVEANKKEIKDPVILNIDQAALASLQKLEFLQLTKFDFRKFPMAILELQNLKALGLNNCILETIPEEIRKMKNLQGLFLRQNRLTKLPTTLALLNQLEVIDLCNNSFIDVPICLKKIPSLEIIYLANYNGVKAEPYTWDWPVELGVNVINYSTDKTALNELLALPKLKALHLHVNNSKIKKEVKGTITNEAHAKKISWQSIDCGCG